MKVVLIPGPRNEELIALVKKLADAESSDQTTCVSMNEYSWDEIFDALYYACENGDEMLADQAQYFTDCLFHDEREYYIERMMGEGAYI